MLNGECGHLGQCRAAQDAQAMIVDAEPIPFEWLDNAGDFLWRNVSIFALRKQNKLTHQFLSVVRL